LIAEREVIAMISHTVRSENSSRVTNSAGQETRGDQVLEKKGGKVGEEDNWTKFHKNGAKVKD